MPFLRSDLGAEVELRSSKSLIGRAASKCDVVLEGNGMLDLHALLTLAEDKASATLMPFATTGNGGMCFVNDQVVRQDGETVVHGDRVAFGDRRNVFVFELTSPSTNRSVTSSMNRSANAKANDSSSVRFRRALDALRGDPSAALPARSRTSNAVPSIGAKASSSSRDQLGQFLKEASADSLLSDYVERKLRQSQSSSSLRRSRHNRPTAMEPPPSLSASSTSSSLLSNSMPNRPPAVQDTADSQSMLSTAERNYVEVEKLQLSQRLREVNNVLNGHLAFRSSYLRKGDDDEMQHNNMADTATSRAAAAESERDDESLEEEDDLPVMVEKKKPIRSPPRPVVQLIAPVAAQDPEGEEDDGSQDELDDHLLDSLPGFSEPIRVKAEIQQIRESISRSDPMLALPNAAPAPSTSDANARPDKAQQRTRLHQQLIDQTIRYKRQEILSHAFVRWRRGLRTQHQNRVSRDQQLQKARLRLVLCRRDNCFFQWKQAAQLMNQVISCRVEAFQRRVASRSLRRVWSEWRIHYLSSRRRSASLGSVLRSHWNKRVQKAFAHWQMSALMIRDKQTLAKCLDEQQSSMDRYKERLSRMQHARHGVRSQLLAILRNWKQHVQTQQSRRECMRRLIKWGFLSKQKRMAWIKWKQVVLLTRHTKFLHNQHDDRLKAAIEEQRQLHQQISEETAAHHEKEAQALRELAEQANTRVRQLQQAKENSEQQQAKRKQQWDTSLERFFKAAAVRYNDQIERVNQELELLIQHSEHDLESARYRAASFLVEAMLEQKVHNASVCMETQKALMQEFQRHVQTRPTNSLDSEDLGSQQLSDNAKFLYEMLQQRLTRQHQLYDALAKLAAAQDDQTLDAKKLRHARFLVNAMRDREARHLDDMQRMFRMQSRFHSPTRAAPGAA